MIVLISQKNLHFGFYLILNTTKYNKLQVNTRLDKNQNANSFDLSTQSLCI